MILAAPTLRAQRDNDGMNNDGALVLENKSPSGPTTRTEETSIGRWKKMHEV